MAYRRTAQEVKGELKIWYEARSAVATGQSYTIGRRTLTRASLSEINRTIADLESELDAISEGNKPRTRRVVPH